MPQAAFGGTSFSTDVDLWLEIDGYPGGRIALSQVGNGFVIVTDPIDHPAGPARVVVSVDGELYRNPVFLANGLSAKEPEARTLNCDQSGVPF